MTYTAKSCREEAAINDKFGDPIMNDPDLLRAFADTLEENARLRANRDFWHEACEQAQQHRDSANEQLAIADAEIARLCQKLMRYEHAEAKLAKLRHAVNLAARAMHGEGVDDQAQAWDVCLRILDAARADFPEEK